MIGSLVGLMRPQIASLPPAARLSSRPITPLLRRTVWTTSRTRPLCSELSRSALSAVRDNTPQKRWITQAYVQRMKDAEKEWKGFAEQIKKGDRISFVEHLEQRQLLNDVVGCVKTILLSADVHVDQVAVGNEICCIKCLPRKGPACMRV